MLASSISRLKRCERRHIQVVELMSGPGFSEVFGHPREMIFDDAMFRERIQIDRVIFRGVDSARFANNFDPTFMPSHLTTWRHGLQMISSINFVDPGTNRMLSPSYSYAEGLSNLFLPASRENKALTVSSGIRKESNLTVSSLPVRQFLSERLEGSRRLASIIHQVPANCLRAPFSGC